MTGFDEMLEFSAETMGLKSVIESKSVWSENENLYASAWTGNNEVLFAAYNDNKEAIHGEVKLSKAVLEGIRSGSVKIFTQQGILAGDNQSKVKFSDQSVRLDLDPHEGVLIAPAGVYGKPYPPGISQSQQPVQ